VSLVMHFKSFKLQTMSIKVNVGFGRTTLEVVYQDEQS